MGLILCTESSTSPNCRWRGCCTDGGNGDGKSEDRGQPDLGILAAISVEFDFYIFHVQDQKTKEKA